MHKKTLVVFLLMLVASAPSFAQIGRGPNGPQSGPRHEALFKKLNLSESQEVQVQKLRLELMKKQTQLRAKLQTLHLDNKGLFLAEKVDRKAIESNIKSISDVQEQLKLNMVDHWFDVNAMLTTEQQKLWKKHAMQMGDQMRQRIMGAGQERMRMRIERRFDDRDIDED